MIKNKELLELGFESVVTSDSVYEDQYGHKPLHAQIELMGGIFQAEWIRDEPDHVRFMRCDTQGNVLSKIYCYSIDEVEEMVNFLNCELEICNKG